MKADKFVMALRDYFDVDGNNDDSMRNVARSTISQYVFSKRANIAYPISSKRVPIEGNTDIEPRAVPVVAEEDEWALQYITLSRIQPLMEAIDDDGSSWVTIKEINNFTLAKPPRWRCALSAQSIPRSTVH